MIHEAGGYSEKYRQYAREKIEKLKAQKQAHTYAHRKKVKELSRQTNDLRRKLEEKKKLREDEEEIRRREILSKRKAVQQSATKKFQRSHVKDSSKKKDTHKSHDPFTLQDGVYNVRGHVVQIKNGKRVSSSQHSAHTNPVPTYNNFTHSIHPGYGTHSTMSPSFQRSVYSGTSYLSNHVNSLLGKQGNNQMHDQLSAAYGKNQLQTTSPTLSEALHLNSERSERIYDTNDHTLDKSKFQSGTGTIESHVKGVYNRSEDQSELAAQVADDQYPGAELLRHRTDLSANGIVSGNSDTHAYSPGEHQYADHPSGHTGSSFCSVTDSLDGSEGQQLKLKSSLKGTVHHIGESKKLRRKVTFSDSIEFNDGNVWPMLSDFDSGVPLYKRMNKGLMEDIPSGSSETSTNQGEHTMSLLHQRIPDGRCTDPVTSSYSSHVPLNMNKSNNVTAAMPPSTPNTEDVLDKLREEALKPHHYEYASDFSSALTDGGNSNIAIVSPMMSDLSDSIEATSNVLTGEISSGAPKVSTITADSIALSSYRGPGKDSSDLNSSISLKDSLEIARKELNIASEALATIQSSAVIANRGNNENTQSNQVKVVRSTAQEVSYRNPSHSSSVLLSEGVTNESSYNFQNATGSDLQQSELSYSYVPTSQSTLPTDDQFETVPPVYSYLASSRESVLSNQVHRNNEITVPQPHNVKGSTHTATSVLPGDTYEGASQASIDSKPLHAGSSAPRYDNIPISASSFMAPLHYNAADQYQPVSEMKMQHNCTPQIQPSSDGVLGTFDPARNHSVPQFDPARNHGVPCEVPAGVSVSSQYRYSSYSRGEDIVPEQDSASGVSVISNINHAAYNGPISFEMSSAPSSSLPSNQSYRGRGQSPMHAPSGTSYNTFPADYSYIADESAKTVVSCAASIPTTYNYSIKAMPSSNAGTVHPLINMLNEPVFQVRSAAYPVISTNSATLASDSYRFSSAVRPLHQQMSSELTSHQASSSTTLSYKIATSTPAVSRTHIDSSIVSSRYGHTYPPRTIMSPTRFVSSAESSLFGASDYITTLADVHSGSHSLSDGNADSSQTLPKHSNFDHVYASVEQSMANLKFNIDAAGRQPNDLKQPVRPSNIPRTDSELEHLPAHSSEEDFTKPRQAVTSSNKTTTSRTESSIPIRIHNSPSSVRRGRIIVSADSKKRKLANNYSPHPPEKPKVSSESTGRSMKGGKSVTVSAVKKSDKPVKKPYRDRAASDSVIPADFRNQDEGLPPRPPNPGNYQNASSDYILPVKFRYSRTHPAPASNEISSRYASKPQRQFHERSTSFDSHVSKGAHFRNYSYDPPRTWSGRVYNRISDPIVVQDGSDARNYQHNIPGGLKSESSAPNGYFPLDKTPTDDEINKLWANVRDCLSQTPDDVMSDSVCVINNNKNSPLRHTGQTPRHLSGTSPRRPRFGGSNPNLHTTPSASSAPGSGRMPFRRYGSQESLIRQDSLDSLSSNNSIVRKQSLLPHRASRVIKGDWMKQPTNIQSSSKGPMVARSKNVTASMASFLALEDMCNTDSLSPSQTEAVFKASKHHMHEDKNNNGNRRYEPSALSVEERCVMESLDRLNEKLRKHETSGRVVLSKPVHSTRTSGQVTNNTNGGRRTMSAKR